MSPRARRAPPSSPAARCPAGSAPAPSRAHLHLPGTAPEARRRGASRRCAALRARGASGAHRGEAAGDGEFLCCGAGCRWEQEHPSGPCGPRERYRAGGGEGACAGFPPAVTGRTSSTLLSASLSATRPLLALVGIHRREESGLVLRELGAEDPEWLAPTPGVWRSPTPWILQSDKGCHATITRVTSWPLTGHRSPRSGALPDFLLGVIPRGLERCGSLLTHRETEARTV